MLSACNVFVCHTDAVLRGCVTCLSACNVFVCHRDAVLRGCGRCCQHVMCSCVTEMLC